ncbi:MAG: protein kinase domain-containing protein [Anaerolineales bacterium]
MIQDSLLGVIINGAYELKAVLARGGMATVYRARQLSTQRDVAVKVLPREFLDDETSHQRFKQEAQISSQLEHRAIVPVYDFGEWNGLPYIVMRLMEGGSVDDMLRRGPVPLPRVQAIVRQVAAGLDYAHQQGVLHRDLKPSNIMLDGAGDAYLTDFGIARLLTYDEKLTATGVVGTPAYMSPEQAQGHMLDQRSDIYALGISLFEMLTGRRPFEADTPYGTAVLQVTKPPPSPRDYNPALPVGVEAVVLRALAKNPAERFESAVILAGALDDADLFIAAQTIQHTPPPMPPHQMPTPQQPQTPVSVSSVAAQRGPHPVLFLSGAFLLAFVLGAALLGGYVALSQDDNAAAPPDFAATGVARLTATAETTPNVESGAGQIVFIAAPDDNSASELYRLNIPTRHITRLTTTAGAEGYLAAAPDGARLVYAYDPDGEIAEDDDNSQLELYVQGLTGENPRQLTSNLLEEGAPAWFPDAQRIIYPQEMSGILGYRLVVQTVPDGEPQIVHTVPGQRLFGPQVGPDGRRVVFGAGQPDDRASWDLYLLDLATDTIARLTNNDQADWAPSWVPGADRILFMRADAEATAIYEMGLDGGTARQIATVPASANGAFYDASGEQILYSSLFEERPVLYIWRRAGTSPLELVPGAQAAWLP